MDKFLTWDVLLTFSGLVTTTYMVAEFTKEIPLIKKIPTKYWSYIIALILLFATNLATGNFKYADIILYLLNAIPVSLSANGLNNFNSGKKEGTGVQEGIGSDSSVEEDV
jgi:hypothetical protein